MVMSAIGLFVALGGVGYAAVKIGSAQITNNSVASRDIKNRTIVSKDISKKTRASLKGQKGDTGATGAKGDPGATGATGAKGDPGATGATGAAGAKGDTGPPGRSALEPLKGGETIRGAWAMRGDGTSSTEFAGITFPIPSPTPVDSAHVVLAGNDGQTGDGCSGTAAAPVSAPGFVCIYLATATNTTAGFGYAALSTGGSATATGDGSSYGFAIRVDGAANWFADGTWAYTAP